MPISLTQRSTLGGFIRSPLGVRARPANRALVWHWDSMPATAVETVIGTFQNFSIPYDESAESTLSIVDSEAVYSGSIQDYSRVFILSPEAGDHVPDWLGQLSSWSGRIFVCVGWAPFAFGQSLVDHANDVYSPLMGMSIDSVGYGIGDVKDDAVLGSTKFAAVSELDITTGVSGLYRDSCHAVTGGAEISPLVDIPSKSVISRNTVNSIDWILAATASLFGDDLFGNLVDFPGSPNEQFLLNLYNVTVSA